MLTGMILAMILLPSAYLTCGLVLAMFGMGAERLAAGLNPGEEEEAEA